MTHGTGMGPLPDLLEHRAGSAAVERVFRDEGVPLGLIEERAHWLPLAALAGLFERAARAAGDPLFGLDVGRQMHPAEFGLWARYAVEAPTLGAAIGRLWRSIGAHQTGGWIELQPRSAGRVALLYRHHEIADPLFLQHTDHVVPAFLRILRGYLGPGWTPHAVEVGYPASAVTARARRDRETATGCAWQFGSAGAGIVFSAEALSHARSAVTGLEGHAPRLTSREVIADMLGSRQTDRSEQIDAVLALRLLDRKTDIDGAASLLGVGRRTLQRQIERSGGTYSERLEHVRMARARALIRETDEPLTAIALDVGYSELAHFSRAFKQRFGYPPSRLRRHATRPAA